MALFSYSTTIGDRIRRGITAKTVTNEVRDIEKRIEEDYRVTKGSPIKRPYR